MIYDFITPDVRIDLTIDSFEPHTTSILSHSSNYRRKTIAGHTGWNFPQNAIEYVYPTTN